MTTFSWGGPEVRRVQDASHFRNWEELRRAKAADAWAVAKYLKKISPGVPLSIVAAEIMKIVGHVHYPQTPDTTPLAIYDHISTRSGGKKAKRPTYSSAQDADI